MTGRAVVVLFRIVSAAVAATMLVSSVWLMVKPKSDQPILDVLENWTGIGPAYFLTPTEQAIYRSAAADSLRFTEEAKQLEAREVAAGERAAHDGTPFADEEVERIGAYRHSFNEMAQGERFVQGVLRERARMHARFIVGAPAAMLSCFCLVWLGYAPRRRASVRRDDVARSSAAAA